MEDWSKRGGVDIIRNENCMALTWHRDCVEFSLQLRSYERQPNP